MQNGSVGMETLNPAVLWPLKWVTIKWMAVRPGLTPAWGVITRCFVSFADHFLLGPLAIKHTCRGLLKWPLPRRSHPSKQRMRCKRNSRSSCLLAGSVWLKAWDFKQGRYLNGASADNGTGILTETRNSEYMGRYPSWKGKEADIQHIVQTETNGLVDTLQQALWGLQLPRIPAWGCSQL